MLTLEELEHAAVHGETAIKLGATLVTDDVKLRQVVVEFGGKAVRSARLPDRRSSTTQQPPRHRQPDHRAANSTARLWRPGRGPDFEWGILERVKSEETTGAELFDEAWRLGLLEKRDRVREEGGGEIE